MGLTGKLKFKYIIYITETGDGNDTKIFDFCADSTITKRTQNNRPN